MATKKEMGFDQAKLMSLQEPLSVRVVRLSGSAEQPIELPAKTINGEQAAPGTNWSRDEVLKLENWLLTEWSGGGYYRFAVTDAKGATLNWESVFDVRLYPPKIPPNTTSALGPLPVPMSGGAPMTQAPPSGPPLGSSNTTGWPPQGAAAGYGQPNPPSYNGPYVVAQQPQQQQPMIVQAAPQPQGQQPVFIQAAPAPQPQPGPWGQGQGGWSSRRPAFDPDEEYYRRRRYMDRDRDDHEERAKREAEERTRREIEERQRALEEKIRLQELEKKDLEYKAQLERIQQASAQQQAQALAAQAAATEQLRQQHAAQMQALQEEMRRLGDHKGKAEDDEVRRLREEQQRMREQALSEQQKLREQAAAEQQRLQAQVMEQQIAAMRQQSEQQVIALREQLSRMNEPKPSGESDELRRLREELARISQEAERRAQEAERRQQEQLARMEREREQEREKHEREKERAEQQRRDDLMRQEIKEQRQAFEAQLQALAQAASTRGSDPMIDALKESSRAQTESMREIARMQVAQSDKMAAFMVAPAQLAEIMMNNRSGQDGMIKNVVESVSGIVGMYRTAAEQIMQMSSGGGEPPAARLIQEGIGRASEIAERYMQVKRDQIISEGKVKTAQAQADTMRSQAEMQARAQAAAQARAFAIAQAQAQQAAQQQAQQAAQAQSGLGGAPAAAPQPVPMEPPAPQAQAPNSLPVTPGQSATPAPTEGARVIPMRGTGGPTEEEMFGLALESVRRLRTGVAEGKLDPSKAIDAILQGVEHVTKNQLQIPAFTLFESERYADFIDCLLPDVPQTFKDECVRILIEEVEVTDEAEDEDDKDDKGGDATP